MKAVHFYCRSLTTIPDMPYLKTISIQTFYDINIKNVGKLDSLETIGDNAFYNNYNMLSFPYCPKLVTIGVEAFYECSKIKEFTFSGKITTISNDAFFYCTRLENITFMPGNGNSLSIQGNAFYRCKSLKNVFIDKETNLTSIIQHAFGYTNVESFYFPKTLKTIEAYAFKNSRIKSIDSAPDGELLEITEHCFEGCTELKHICLLNSVTNIMNFTHFFLYLMLYIYCNI